MPFRWCPFCSWCPFFGAPLDGAPLAVPLWQCPFDGAPLDGAPLTVPLWYCPFSLVPLWRCPFGSAPSVLVPLWLVPLFQCPFGRCPIFWCPLDSRPKKLHILQRYIIHSKYFSLGYFYYWSILLPTRPKTFWMVLNQNPPTSCISWSREFPQCMVNQIQLNLCIFWYLAMVVHGLE